MSLQIHDGYGQTETGHLTGMPIGPPSWPEVDGPPPAFRAWVDDGELVIDPATVPTFFIDGPRHQPWRTGDRVREDEDGYLWFEGRADDVIISAGYRIGPFEVESALVSHPAVAEAAAVAAPDDERGQVVQAVVVLRDSHTPGPEARTRAPGAREIADGALQVPHIVDFAPELPKTPSGEIKRARKLRDLACCERPGDERVCASGRSGSRLRKKGHAKHEETRHRARCGLDDAQRGCCGPRERGNRGLSGRDRGGLRVPGCADQPRRRRSTHCRSPTTAPSHMIAIAKLTDKGADRDRR